jgi:hypothetical protein
MPNKRGVALGWITCWMDTLCRVLLHLWTRASHGTGVQTAAVSLSDRGFAH